MSPLFNRDENGVSPAFGKDRKQDELNKHAGQLHSFLIIILSSLIVVHLRIASCVRRTERSPVGPITWIATDKTRHHSPELMTYFQLPIAPS